ncbi:ComF family protein [Paenibacillus sambharensis]|uniref:ComF family protein n=1 Tax=Paenibacillus sambharensis TaxID=1803190 RepID=A0A2W1LIN1_9BACL|nr:ComF family protein [Paenibacillus sambharensis]PZD97830.1 ComF family protein [Paenibacillus sambharensis]
MLLLDRIMSWAAQGLQAGVGFLQEQNCSCLVCGRNTGGRLGMEAGHSFNGWYRDLLPVQRRSVNHIRQSISNKLCAGCLALIPWLTEIKCRACGRGIACPDCERRSRPAFRYNRSAVQYDSAMRDWLALYKYRGLEKLEPLLAEMLYLPYYGLSRLAAEAGSNLVSCGSEPWDMVTYVPVSSERAQERGFNQAERLAAALGSQFHLPVLPLLIRTRHSGKQSLKSRRERVTDMRSLFAPDEAGWTAWEYQYQQRWNPSGKQRKDKRSNNRPLNSPIRILLIDDIYTTGSTIEACSEVLKYRSKVTCEVYSLTWSRS